MYKFNMPLILKFPSLGEKRRSTEKICVMSQIDREVRIDPSFLT